MKKIFIAIVATFAITATTYAQGYVAVEQTGGSAFFESVGHLINGVFKVATLPVEGVATAIDCVTPSPRKTIVPVNNPGVAIQQPNRTYRLQSDPMYYKGNAVHPNCYQQVQTMPNYGEPVQYQTMPNYQQNNYYYGNGTGNVPSYRTVTIRGYAR